MAGLNLSQESHWSVHPHQRTSGQSGSFGTHGHSAVKIRTQLDILQNTPGLVFNWVSALQGLSMQGELGRHHESTWDANGFWLDARTDQFEKQTDVVFGCPGSM